MSEIDSRDQRLTPDIPYREMEESIELSHIAHPESDELLTINFGPHHPATHGVLRLITTLEAEVVRDIKPVIGYVHTGIEKTAEDKAYWKAIPVVERMDYLAYYFNAMAFCGAVETILDLEVPPRAQYLRVIHMELNRIMSHLVWLGTTALDLGAISMFWYCFRDREQILDLFEMSSGQRMHTRYFQVGGVFEDIPVGWEEKVRAFTEMMPDRVDQFLALLMKNEIVLQRLRGVAPLDEETLLDHGVTGPLLRAAGNPWDLRKADAVLLLRALRLQDPGRHDRRQLGPHDRADHGDQGVLPDHRPGARRPARGPVHHRRPQVRAAAAPRAGDEHGGADPPLQARHRGLPRAAGRVLLPDRVAARRDGLLRALRRLLQARARAHARPLVREPAGLPPDGPRPLHRRLHRDARHARPGARRASTADGGHRPVAGSAATSTAAASPAGTTRSTSTKEPADVPDPATTPVPDELRAEIEDYMAATRTSARRRSPRCTPRSELHGWCSPTAIEQVACVMRLTPGYLTAVATFYDMFETVPEGPRRRLRVHEHLLLAARRRRALRGDARRRGRRPGVPREVVRVPRRVRHRADGVGRRRVRRPARARPTAAQIVEDVKAGRPVLEAKQLPHTARRRGAERDAAPLRQHRPARPEHARRLPARARRLRDARRARSTWSPPTCSPSSRPPACAAAAAPASRWARRRRSCPRATWTSTSSATPTSPSRGRSRTAS